MEYLEAEVQMMLQFKRITHSSPERLTIQRLLFSYAEKSRTSYWELTRHKDRWYVIYDDEQLCGCAIPLSLGESFYTICIFNDVRYCSAELRPVIIAVAVMDYQPEWIDVDCASAEQVKNL